jgi:hypothetical protein
MSTITAAIIIYAIGAGSVLFWNYCASKVNRRWDAANEQYQRTVDNSKKV